MICNGVLQRPVCDSSRSAVAHTTLGSLRRARVMAYAAATETAAPAKGGRGGRGGKGGRDQKRRLFKSSDGQQHLGSSQTALPNRPFPGPPPNEGPPLRVLPIGGLGEIGMNCMLVGVKDRYILVDAGLMFPDFSDLGMQKILPDTSFLAQWRDKIEAVVITHGHEDHIGALPWVIPALDPSTPIYAGAFVMELVQRRAMEFSLHDPNRFRIMHMKQPQMMGPFEVTPIRVTHSIPDCCGLIMRSEHGTIVHTGDWKIDEDPMDGDMFDRESFDLLSKEPVALMMSDSTNVLSPGRTLGEKTVEKALVNRVLGHAGKGRVICTQFASNLHRLASVKQAADASGRRICFIGMSLNTYLEAAHKIGRAPFDPKELIQPEQLKDYDPSKVLVVTTGSQAEPRAQLSLASRQASHHLTISNSDLVCYSAKVIPGNEGNVTRMLNSISMLGAQVAQGRGENLHTSGHAYQDELEEVLRYVKPQHFLPVHGEYSFLCEHARLARERAGVLHTRVIKNGQMLGIHERSNRREVASPSSMAVATMNVLGEARLVNFYNDGMRGTGTAAEMALQERKNLAFEGVVVVAVDVIRSGQALRGQVRVTTRGMWLDKGRLLDKIHESIENTVAQMPSDSSLAQVERAVVDVVKRVTKVYNSRSPEVICVTYEHDPRVSHLPDMPSRRGRSIGGRLSEADPNYVEPPPQERGGRGGRGGSGGRGGGAGRMPWQGQQQSGGWTSSRGGSSGTRQRTNFDGEADMQQRQQQQQQQQQQGPSSQQGWGDVEASGSNSDADTSSSTSRSSSPSTSSAASAIAARLAARGSSSGRGVPRAPPSQVLPPGVLERRRAANPRDSPSEENDVDYG